MDVSYFSKTIYTTVQVMTSIIHNLFHLLGQLISYLFYANGFYAICLESVEQ